MGKKKDDKYRITELFLVKADWNRTYTGTIKREIDADGLPLVRGSVIVDEGVIHCKADCEDQLALNMDAICVMKLDVRIHQSAGVTSQICGNSYFLN